MLHPSYTDLMKVVNSEAEHGDEPIINSRYSIVIATSRRARQLIEAQEEGEIINCFKPLSIAVDELNGGDIKIVSEDDIAEEEIDLNRDIEEVQKPKENEDIENLIINEEIEEEVE